MQKKLLLEMLTQNQLTCSFALNAVTRENAGYRVNEQAASVGFIFRHIGETMNLFGGFFGVPTEIQNTTMGQYETPSVFLSAFLRVSVGLGILQVL